MAPHIGLNAQLLSTASSYRSAGISGYIYNLLLNLAKLDSPYRYRIFLNDRHFKPTSQFALNYSRWPTQKPTVRILWEQLLQPLALQQNKIDLYHGMAFVAPAFYSLSLYRHHL